MKREIDVESLELTKVIERLEKGQYAIPIFQRDFVWDTSNIRDLWDSIYRHYPIGSFLIWETDEQLPKHRSILNINLIENDKGKYNYILDGQQRITSIIGAVKGATRKRTSFQLYFDLQKGMVLSQRNLTDQLNSTPFLTEKELKDVKDESQLDFIIPLNKLLDFDTTKCMELMKSNVDIANYYMLTSERLRKDYQISIIKLNNVPIEEVCDIFTRVNQKGKKLSIVDLMIAKTYKQDEFYLRDNIDELQDQLNKETYLIDELVYLRCLSANYNKKCTESDILQLSTETIQMNWEDTANSLIQAIRFLKNELGITSPKILPYTTMLVPLAYFFSRLHDNTFHDEYKKSIKIWFWRSCLSGHYQSHTNEKVHSDCEWFDDLLIKRSLDPKIPKFTIDLETIIDAELNINNAFCNSILCIMATKKPIDFFNHQKININEVLIKRQKSELHHIFPRKSKIGKKHSDTIDSIANICFLPKDTNNKKINNKEPNEYFPIARTDNKSYFIRDLESQLIPNADISPIWTNDYDNFLIERATLIINEINNLLVIPKS